MNQDQLGSLVRSLLKVLGTLLLTHGLTKVGNIALAEDTFGLIMGIAGFIMSHMKHSDDPKVQKAGDVGTGAAVVIVALGILFQGLVGCSTKTLEVGGAYHPGTFTEITLPDGTVQTNVVETSQQDWVLYVADGSFKVAYSTLQTALKFERDNRAALWKLSPNIKHTLDAVRPQAWDAVKRYTTARKAYMANPIPANATTLQSVLEEVSNLAAAAQAAITTQQPSN